MEPSIPRTASLSLWQITALYISSVLGSGILLLPGLTADIAGPGSLLAWFLMSILAVPMALTMGLLSVKFPHAGGVSHFVAQAFSQKAGSLVGWFFLLSSVVAVPVIALTGAGYTASAFCLGESGRIVIAFGILLVCFATNFIGMRLTGQVQMAVVVATVLILVGTIIGSIPSIRAENFVPFTPHGLVSIGQSATLIFWCFLGWEAISHVTEEFENPSRDVVKGTIIASVIISLLYVATAYVVVGTHSYGPGISEVSLIHLINLSFGSCGTVLAGCITLFITTAPSIAYTGAAARLSYTLSRNGYAPASLGLLHSRYRTPVGALCFLLTSFLLILLVYIMGIFALDLLITIPNATFILTYLGGCLAGFLLLRDSRVGRLVSAVSFLLTAVIFLFIGWSLLWPFLITFVWFVYVRKRA